MKCAFIFCLMLQALVVASAENEWPGVKFAEVRAYAWPDDKKHIEEDLILKDMSLKTGVSNPEGAKLSDDQIKKLISAVTGKHPEHELYKCYIPHNAFVFYDSDKKPVAFVEVCFDCLGRRAEPKGVALRIDYPALAKIFGELNLRLGSWATADAFSDHFKKLLTDPDNNEPVPAKKE